MGAIMAAGSRYGVTLKQLRELMESRGAEGVQKVQDFGGVHEIARKLNTSEASGLSGEKSDLEHRQDVFGSNTIPPKPPWSLCGKHSKMSPLSSCKWPPWCPLLFLFTNHPREIVVGDIISVKYGDLLPADGLVMQSNDLKVDESSLTGESDQVNKGIGTDPMVLSGTHVMEGSGKILVTAVGVNSQAGIIFTLLGAAAEEVEDMKKKKRKDVEEGIGNALPEPPL